MKFTVVIPNYNYAKYIGESIESVLAQSFKDYELIVVDDGSTDNSVEVISKYPVKLIKQVNKGLASARNTGIMNAEGEYILFLDSDDLLLPNCLEVMSQHNEDIIAPSFRTFGENSSTLVLKPEISLEDMKKGNHLPYFSAIKKEKLLEVGGYSPRMVWGYEDYHLWFNLLTKGCSLKSIQDVLVMYRSHKDSMITNSQLHHNELMAQIYKDFPNI